MWNNRLWDQQIHGCTSYIQNQKYSSEYTAPVLAQSHQAWDNGIDKILFSLSAEMAEMLNTSHQSFPLLLYRF